MSQSNEDNPILEARQNIEGEGQGSTGSSNTDTSTINSLRKRREYHKRSVAWQHFSEFVDAQGRKKCKCNYCNKEYSCASKSCGTSTLLTHIKNCPLNPISQTSIQSQLAFNSSKNEETGEEMVNLLAWRFDQQVARRAIAEMIIIDELPFKFVENVGFKRCMKACQPALVIPSRSTVTRDCYQLFLDEKAKLKSQIKHTSVRVCLTTDTWTSLQRINYMCLTVHFIDSNWKLQKKVINFCPISSHKGQDIGVAIELCLVDWGLRNVFTVTVDNASSNDVALDYLKRKCANWGGLCVLQGKWMHVRCIAHIMNLIVQDGLKDLGGSIESIRAAIKYVRQSPSRLKKFMRFAELEKCECNKSLCLDVPTRWNSTYLMLSVAQLYERAFDRLEMEDDSYRDDLQNHGSKPGVPSSWDWKNVKRLVVFLRHFYVLTLRVSGTKYVTANSYLDDICGIYGVLKECMSSEDDDFRNMAAKMKKKFDKYWGSVEKFNMLVFVACVFDPRSKFDYCDIVLCNMYGDDEGRKMAENVKSALFELFNEFKRIHSDPHFKTVASSSSLSSGSISLVSKSFGNDCDVDPLMKIKEKNLAALKKRKADSGANRDAKSELDRYLTEDDEEDKSMLESPAFNILDWWKIKSPAFPILSLLARNVLAIPISTVASESTFSTGGRVLDSFRSSLTPKIVQALICTQDWMRLDESPVNVEENIEELEKFEQELKQSMPESTVVDI